jgi:transcriptional regulator of acetoin/glycerol metabolism
MTQLVAAVGAMRYFCLLTDAQGLALEVQGPVDHSDLRALAVGRVGVDLSERGVGTSAIGATLAELSPVWLHRQEHF